MNENPSQIETGALSGEAGPRAEAKGAVPRIAYVMSRFPKITETFVLYEILELERQGVAVEIFPLLREQESVVHPDAPRLIERAHYQPFLSAGILAANLSFLLRRPLRYLGTLFLLLWEALGSLNFFFGTLGVWPKTVANAARMTRLGVTHIHAHFANHPATAALIIHRLTGIPYSFTAHGSDLHKEQRMLRLKCRYAAFVVTISDYNRQFIIRHAGADVAERIRVVHCGIDPQVFISRPPAVNQGPLRILCVASFREVKGHRYLIEACAILAEAGLDFECHLVGDGPRRAEIEGRIAAAGLGERFHLHGNQPRQAVAERMQQADIAVLASIRTASGQREGIPVVLMEAMASGLPVVSSRQSGIPELVADGETGLLVPAADAAALAGALQALAADPARRQRMGAAGRAKVIREFDLADNVRRLAVLAQSGGGEPSDAEPS